MTEKYAESSNVAQRAEMSEKIWLKMCWVNFLIISFLVCLQMDNNLRLFPYQQMDKRQTSVCTMS